MAVFNSSDQKDIGCVGDFEDCNNLVENLRKNSPDVALMDIHMPGVDGIDGVKLLQKHYPQTNIIIQTIFEDDESLFNSLLAGAYGYMLKKTTNEKLIEGIIEVVNGGAPMSPGIAKRVLEYIGNKNSKARQNTFIYQSEN
ncbi:response regulator [Mucilaginibacter sp.]|uniref:response regulator n=1 Tax=Mucilaginibacter sp. TaxID=1882438 RepID=UPI003B00A6F7